MKQSVIADYSKDEILSATLVQDIINDFNKTTLYPQESVFQIAKKYELEPSQVIRVWEDYRGRKS